jgi:hypothetical protein
MLRAGLASRWLRRCGCWRCKNPAAVNLPFKSTVAFCGRGQDGRVKEKTSMNQLFALAPVRQGIVSPLVLSDRLIALAQDADRAGYTGTAEQLLCLACTVFDEAPQPRH